MSRVVRSVALLGLLSAPAALAMSVAGPAPARAQTATPTPSVSLGPSVPPHPQDQIVLSGHVTVARGETVGEVVVINGRAQVLGVVVGDVVVVNGSILVSGQVSGSVVALDGSVRVGASAAIAGDVVARQDVEVAEGAVVGGRVRAHAAFTLREPLAAVGRFASWVAVSVSTLLLGLLLLLFAPRGADRVDAAARQAPWASVAWGLALALAIPALAGVALISLVALPLGLVVILALALVAFVSYAWAAWILGRQLIRDRGRVPAYLAGWAMLRTVGLIPVVSGITFGLAAVAGLGATAVAIWRARGTAPRRGGLHRRGYVAPQADPEIVQLPPVAGLAAADPAPTADPAPVTEPAPTANTADDVRSDSSGTD